MRALAAHLRNGVAGHSSALAGLAAAPSVEDAARYSVSALKTELQRRKISAKLPVGSTGDAAKALLAPLLISLWDISATGADVSTTAMPELPAVEVRSRPSVAASAALPPHSSHRDSN